MASPDPQPPVFTTRLVDRINFAIQFEKWRDVFLKRWWIFSLCTLIPIVYATWQGMKKPDIFEAIAKVTVEPKNTVPIATPNASEFLNFTGTQVQLMQSLKVQEAAKAKVKQETGLEKDASLRVFWEKNSFIFNFSVTSTDPHYAELFLTSLINEYIQVKKKMRKDSTEDTTSTILLGVDRLRSDLDKVEQEIIDFQKDNNMASIEVQGNSAAQYLSELNRRLAEIKTNLGMMESETIEQNPDKVSASLLDRILKFNSGTTSNPQETKEPGLSPTSRNSQAITELSNIKNQIVLLKAERADQLNSYQPKHPRITKLDEEISRKERLYEVTLQQAKDQVKQYRDSMISQEKALVTQIQEWEKQALDSNQKNERYNNLKSKQARIRELYNILLKRLQEIDVGANLNKEMITIAEPVRANLTPIGPNRSSDVIKAGALGFMLALGIILLLERFDDRVKNIDELQEMTQETMLGQIPMMPSAGKKREPLFMANLPIHNSFSESFRNVRSSLMFSTSGGTARTMVVTSAIPNDGKTTCAVNLATSLAQIEGGKTLLVDADMRKMNVHTYFKVENGPGLSEILSGQAKLEDCIVPTVIPNLFLLRAGEAPPNPGELILSDNFQKLLNDATAQFQRVVLDTPPVLSTDDALSLAPKVDGVIFVVKANQTSIRFVDRSLTHLRQRGTKIFGVILNQIDTTSAHYYYYYYYTGYYNYSHKEKDGKKSA